MEKTREELIEELKMEMNPGSMSVECLIEKMVDQHLEDVGKVAALEAKNKELETKVNELETSKRYWWGECDKKDEDIQKLKRSMKVISDVTSNICELWNL